MACACMCMVQHCLQEIGVLKRAATEQMALDGNASGAARHEYFVGSPAYTMYREGMEIQSALLSNGSCEQQCVA